MSQFHCCDCIEDAELNQIYFASYLLINIFVKFHSLDVPCMPTAVLVFLITFFFFHKEKHELQPHDLAISKSLDASGRIYVYQKDLADTLVRTFSLYLKHILIPIQTPMSD